MAVEREGPSLRCCPMEEGAEGKERGRERDGEEVGGPAGVESAGTDEGSRVVVSPFNDSAEEFMSAMETMSSLCGFQEEEFDPSEIQRFSSMVTFLKEWRYFCYESKVVNFTFETESPHVKEDIKGIKLPQFSSASVPKREQSHGGARSLNSEDFVLHACGSVWALDWCPRMNEMLDHPIKCEYLAVAAHPPDSSYHNIGTPLTGRGIVQIWCLLNMNDKDESFVEWSRLRDKKGPGSRQSLGGSNVKSKLHPPRPRGRPRKKPLIREPLEGGSDVPNTPPKRPRGRPRKRPLIDDVDVGEDLSPLRIIPASADDDTHVKDKSLQRRPRGRPRKTSDEKDKVHGLHAVKDLGSSEIISFAVHDSNAKSIPLPCKRRGRPRKKPNTEENVDAEVVDDVNTAESIHSHDAKISNLKSNLSPQRRPRGRPKKKPDEVAAVNDLHIVQDLGIMECASNQSISDPNITRVDESHIVQDLSIIPAQFINCSDVGNKSSLTKRRRGRPKKGSGKSLSDVNGQKCDSPVQGPAHCVNDIVVSDIVEQAELRKDAYALPMTSGTDVLQGCHMEEGSSTIDSTDLCMQGSSKLRAVSDSSTPPIVSMKDMEPVDSVVRDSRHSSYGAAQKVVPLPRVVLCLGHNGKVAWDVKWRPYNISDMNFKHRMGYLAVLLGNGSLEVWEVPYPRMVKNLYKSCFKEGTDPRFMKLRPVFRCSELKFAGRQSIPLTLEWSRSAPSDRILVGCHDGTVALWKFSAEDSSQETRPLLCFTADNVPIRAVAWAPGESDSESANLIVTAGHEGLKFWDVRDPYRPLWDFYPAQRIILSLDWLQHPSSLIFSLDDGTIKTLSLWKAANKAPVTGKPYDGSKHGVVHNYYRSQFAIWSVQASPVTGLAAYCCADGSTLYFQITAKSIDMDRARYRSPHFLCGTLVEIENSLTIDTPIQYTSVAELPRPVRGLPTHSSCPPVENPQDQGDDPDENLGYRNSKPFERRNMISKPSKSGTLLDKHQNADILTTGGDENGENLGTEIMNTGPPNQNFLVLPPKIVAMHRVRWNINRGSERWLCYGGAAGIIRCQEIALPS